MPTPAPRLRREGAADACARRAHRASNRQARRRRGARGSRTARRRSRSPRTSAQEGWQTAARAWPGPQSRVSRPPAPWYPSMRKPPSCRPPRNGRRGAPRTRRPMGPSSCSTCWRRSATSTAAAVLQSAGADAEPESRVRPDDAPCSTFYVTHSSAPGDRAPGRTIRVASRALVSTGYGADKIVPKWARAEWVGRHDGRR